MTQQSAKLLEAFRAYSEERLDAALRLMEECASDGDPVACLAAAEWHGSGKEFPLNKERSDYWLNKLEDLAETGNPKAQWELGQSHRFGNFLPLDIERANYWLERAAESGYADAQHHLAWYLEAGEYGFPIDSELAAKWYQRAFAQDNAENSLSLCDPRFPKWKTNREVDSTFEEGGRGRVLSC